MWKSFHNFDPWISPIIKLTNGSLIECISCLIRPIVIACFKTTTWHMTFTLWLIRRSFFMSLSICWQKFKSTARFWFNLRAHQRILIRVNNLVALAMSEFLTFCVMTNFDHNWLPFFDCELLGICFNLHIYVCLTYLLASDGYYFSINLNIYMQYFANSIIVSHKDMLKTVADYLQWA